VLMLQLDRSAIREPKQGAVQGPTPGSATPRGLCWILRPESQRVHRERTGQVQEHMGLRGAGLPLLVQTRRTDRGARSRYLRP
jgi:hypothetical protein